MDVPFRTRSCLLLEHHRPRMESPAKAYIFVGRPIYPVSLGFHTCK